MSLRKNISKFLILTIITTFISTVNPFVLVGEALVNHEHKTNSVNSEGRIIVAFKEGYDVNINSDELKDLEIKSFRDLSRAKKTAKDNGTNTENKKKKKTVLLCLKDKSTNEVLRVLKKLNNEPNVAYAEPDFLMKTTDTPNPTDSYEMYNMDRIGAPQAMEKSKDSPDVVVGIIDSGIDYEHSGLKENMWVNEKELKGTKGDDDDGNGYVDDIYGYDFGLNKGCPIDPGDHGTHCAGIVAGMGDNIKIASLKHHGDFNKNWSSNIIEAINYAKAMDFNILSCSMGIPKNGIDSGFYECDSKALNEAINDAGLFVTAAGNNSSNIDEEQYTFYPACCSSENIITVANSDINDNLYRSDLDGSNYGVTSVDLAAPGENIYSTLPNGSYGLKTGTSMATPHVAGAAALLLSANTSLTTKQLKNLILSSVDPTSDLKGKVATGGRLNVAKAMDKIRGLVKIGDIDSSGTVDSIDFGMLNAYLSGKNPNLTYKQLVAADIVYTENIEVNSIDFANFRKYLLDTNHPCNAGKTYVYTYGDVDNNGTVNENDYNIVKECLSNKIELKNKQLLAADADGDNTITQVDVELIKAYIDGTITNLPVEN